MLPARWHGLPIQNVSERLLGAGCLCLTMRQLAKMKDAYSLNDGFTSVNNTTISRISRNRAILHKTYLSATMVRCRGRASEVPRTTRISTEPASATRPGPWV